MGRTAQWPARRLPPPPPMQDDVQDNDRIFRSEDELARLSASERIRYRLVGAGR